MAIEKSWNIPERCWPSLYIDKAFGHIFKYKVMTGKEPYLYSFVGSTSTYPARHQLMQLSHPRGYLEDTSGKIQSAYIAGDQDAIDAFQDHFETITHQSQFVLCPRGVCTSSLRVYEAMQMGRVPVILADEWVEPTGMDWEQFSIRIPEADIRHIPDILSERASEAPNMGQQAYAAWEKYCNREAIFDYMMDACLELKDQGQSYSLKSRFLAHTHLFRRWCHLKPFIKFALKSPWKAWRVLVG